MGHGNIHLLPESMIMHAGVYVGVLLCVGVHTLITKAQISTLPDSLCISLLCKACSVTPQHITTSLGHALYIYEIKSDMMKYSVVNVLCNLQLLVRGGSEGPARAYRTNSLPRHHVPKLDNMRNLWLTLAQSCCPNKENWCFEQARMQSNVVM